MNTLDFTNRLQTLVEAGKRARLSATDDFSDPYASLPAEKANAWAAFLSSIATTESVEGLLLEPIRKRFAFSEEAVQFLDQQGADERRHHEMLSAYVKRTFQHEKKRRSLSDRVVYDSLLPVVSRLGEARPLCLISALRFYEAFSVDFYKTLKTLATNDGLRSLVGMIQAIEKDELRHLAGLEALADEHRRRHGGPSRTDVIALRALLALLLTDISVSRWALHNRHVRRNASILGIEASVMNRDARRAARSAVAFAKGDRP